MRLWRLASAFGAIFTYNWITVLGSVLVTVSAWMILALVVLAALGIVQSVYLGILAFLVLPGFFVAGLVIIPLGVLWEHRKRRRQAAEPAERVAAFPVIDFNVRRVRDVAVVVTVLTVVNWLILGTVSYMGVVYTDSVEFCGLVCHKVMEPEFTAYMNSPHSRVACVKCHIGPGASWFARSKLSGVRQVFAVLFDTYPRPIPTPVHNLRPSTETCEQCHWPERFSGDRVRVIPEFYEDAENTLVYTVLVMHVGGGQAGEGGIHSWHIDPDKRTTYLATDEERQVIEVVRVTDAQGNVTQYKSAGSRLSDEAIAQAPFRTMDCIDCHNRPTHTFQTPAKALDERMADDRIDKTLPSIKSIGVEALSAAPADEGGLETIARHVRTFYRDEYPEVFASNGESIEQAIAELQDIYQQNVFPDMNVTWDTYPNHLGHTQSPGCFRCHDDSHQTESGEVIRQECTICHTILAWQESEPEILDQLAPK